VRIAQTTPLLQAVDAPFDGVALLVCLRIETWRPASGSPSPQAVSDLAGRLRDDGANAPPSEMAADRAGRIRAVREDGLRPSPGPAESAPGDADPGHDGLECRSIARLTSGDVEGQRPCPVVAGQMYLRTQAATRTSECVVVGF
jgi:hypothetical protein